MKPLGLLFTIAATLLVPSTLLAQAEGRRMALVIGIGAYDSLESLDRSVSDAWEVGDVLRREAQFTVTPVMDASAALLRQQVTDFAARIQSNDVVVIYYAGHGIQVDGRNYLVPSDFPPDATKLPTMAISADELLELIGGNNPSMKLLILDACRNSPLAGVASRGLAPMEPAAFGAGTRIEFAASAGQAARDGLFADELVAELARPGQDVDAVFRNVRAAVADASGGLQTTMSASQLTMNFYFIPAQLARPGEALEVLERVSRTMPRGELGQTEALQALVQQRYSLAGTELLAGLAFERGTFNGADLEGALLTGTDFDGASLREADVSRASLIFADLNAADLTGGRADSAAFAVAELDSARLAGVHALGSTWLATRGRGTDFTGADLGGAGFMFADLRGAKFDGANLSDAVFMGSDLRGASFAGALLGNTNLTGTRLDSDALSASQSSGACRLDLPVVPDGTYGYVFTVVGIEPIPSSRFSGGWEYSRFTETRHLFRLPVGNLPTCRTRTAVGDGWFPLWQARGEDRLRDDISFRIPHEVLEQAGRRAEVESRIQSHLEWLYPFPSGEYTATISPSDLPADGQSLAGTWSLNFMADGTLRLDHSNGTSMDARYSRETRYRMTVTGPSDVLGCEGRPGEYDWYAAVDGQLKLVPSRQDSCAARAMVLRTTDWRPRSGGRAGGG